MAQVTVEHLWGEGLTFFMLRKEVEETSMEMWAEAMAC